MITPGPYESNYFKCEYCGWEFFFKEPIKFTIIENKDEMDGKPYSWYEAIPEGFNLELVAGDENDKDVTELGQAICSSLLFSKEHEEGSEMRKFSSYLLDRLDKILYNIPSGFRVANKLSDSLIEIQVEK